MVLFYLRYVSVTRLCLRKSLASCSRLRAQLSDSIFCMAAAVEGRQGMNGESRARSVMVQGFENGPGSHRTCHLLLPQRVGLLLGDGGQMLHTDPEEEGSNDGVIVPVHL